MKAIIWTKYGPPEGLQLRDVQKPVPKAHEVLVRVHATTVTAGDCEVRSLKMPLMLGLPVRLYAGLYRPKRLTILGQELSGVIEAVGENISKFKAGDAVFGTPGFSMGAYAEYACVSLKPDAGVLAFKADKISFEEAAALPVGGFEALHFLRAANLQNGERILINGAGGSIGTIAVQLARHYRAEVSAVDSADKLELLRSLGAQHLIDYTREDFTARGETYDVIFDVVGKSHFTRSMEILNPGGRYLLGNPRVASMLRGALMSKDSTKKVITATSTYNEEDLLTLQELVASGVIKIVIDRRYPLEETADAHSYVESGQKKGHVVIKVTK